MSASGPATKPKRKRPLGPAIAWTDVDLDRLSQVDQTALDDAAVWWREHSPKLTAGLLDAEAVTDE